MRKNLILAAFLAIVVVFVLGVANVALAQYPPPPYPGDWGRIFGRTDNPDLSCSIQRRISREGDIVWLQMTCRAYRGER